MLYPGDYSLLIDNQPMTMVEFTLTGSEKVLDVWPQPPEGRKGKGVKGLEDYFVAGYGSEQVAV